MSRKNKKSEEKIIQNGVVSETIKKRPINKTKLLRRTGTTVVMAVIFGAIASLTILVLEPYVSRMLTKEETVQPTQVTFREDTEEMSPEQMLAEYMAQEAQLQMDALAEEEEPQEDPVDLPLNEEQVRGLLSKVVMDKKNYRQIYASLASYSRELGHCVVTITASQETEDWLTDVSETKKQTSAVIIGENGYDLLLLADYTFIDGAEDLNAAFYDGEVASVTVKAVESQTNLVVLAVDLSQLSENMRNNLPIAIMGNSNATFSGIPVIALGSPLGSTGSLGYGMISANKSVITDVDASYSLLQTDIYGSTNASGVLFNLSGNVIGIITNDHAENGLSNLIRAYAISDIKQRIESLSNGTPIRYVGIKGCDVPASAISQGLPNGAYILSTEMDSPAMREGIQSGDIITSINGTPISTYAEYIAALQQSEIGSPLIIKIQRLSQDVYREMYFTVTIEGLITEDNP